MKFLVSQGANVSDLTRTDRRLFAGRRIAEGASVGTREKSGLPRDLPRHPDRRGPCVEAGGADPMARDRRRLRNPTPDPKITNKAHKDNDDKTQPPLDRTLGGVPATATARARRGEFVRPPGHPLSMRVRGCASRRDAAMHTRRAI